MRRPCFYIMQFMDESNEGNVCNTVGRPEGMRLID